MASTCNAKQMLAFLLTAVDGHLSLSDNFQSSIKEAYSTVAAESKSVVPKAEPGGIEQKVK